MLRRVIALKDVVCRGLNPVTFAPRVGVTRFLSAPANRSPPANSRIPIQVTYHQLIDALSQPQTLLIDVREPGELTSDGRISEKAKNIPLGQLEVAIGLDGEEFVKKYGFPKPSTDTMVVIHCKLGIRATKAALALWKIGYTNVIVYPGVHDWVENGGALIKK